MKTNVIPIHNGARLMPLQYQQAASQLMQVVVVVMDNRNGSALTRRDSLQPLQTNAS